jgi:hypothetical protein
VLVRSISSTRRVIDGLEVIVSNQMYQEWKMESHHKTKGTWSNTHLESKSTNNNIPHLRPIVSIHSIPHHRTQHQPSIANSQYFALYSSMLPAFACAIDEAFWYSLAAAVLNSLALRSASSVTLHIWNCVCEGFFFSLFSTGVVLPKTALRALEVGKRDGMAIFAAGCLTAVGLLSLQYWLAVV